MIRDTNPCAGLRRREFLAWTGVAGAAALAAGCTSDPVDAPEVIRATSESPLNPEDGVLVVVTLYGGNDGLSTLIPAGHDTYQRLRPQLAYAPNEVLDIGDGLGLNPALTGLKGLWDNKQLAVVRGVGYPEPDRSHFKSMAIWQSAEMSTPDGSGWLGRWLDAVATSPMDGLALDPVMPALMTGKTRTAAAFASGRTPFPSGPLGAALRQLASTSPQDGPLQADVATSFADLQTLTNAIEPVLAQQRAATAAESADAAKDNANADEQQGGSAGARSELAAQLDLVATLVELGCPTRVYSVSLGGFDTHADERATQERLLGQLDAALAAFQKRLDTTARGRQVATMVYSEFGRRVQANDSQGTDHGSSGPVLLLGRGVKGGFHGEEPDLDHLVRGDLAVTTDFRGIYAAVLQTVLGTDPARVLPGWKKPLDGLFT